MYEREIDMDPHKSQKDMMMSIEYCMDRCAGKWYEPHHRRNGCYKDCIDYRFYLKSMSSGYAPFFAILSPCVSKYGEIPKYWT